MPDWGPVSAMKLMKKAGAVVEADRQKLFDAAEMIIKVKEPLEPEYTLFHEGQILYTYLHLAADKPQTEALLAKKVIAVGYETVTEADGGLPLLAPMSQIAGRMAVQEGAKYLERPFGGCGILLGGVPGVRKGKVVIIGAGEVGSNACRIAAGMGADVTILDISTKRLEVIENIFGNTVSTLYLVARQSQVGFARSGSGDRRGSDSRRDHSPAGPPGRPCVDETRHGHGGRGDRPGRLL